MDYQQLVQPNLAVAGVPDYCLAYVQEVFNVPASNPHDPDAWQGWLDTQFKHEDRNLPSVAVPIWCAWSGTVEGVYSNYGHVAVWTGAEVYTNPLSGSGHKVFPSIEAMETSYGVKFVGWSEDIETLRVIKEGDMPTLVDEYINNDLAKGFLDVEPANSNPNLVGHVGQDVAQAIREYSAYPEHQALLAHAAAYDGDQKKIADLTTANLKLTDQLKTQPAPTDPNSVTVTQTGLWAAFKKFLGL